MTPETAEVTVTAGEATPVKSHVQQLPPHIFKFQMVDSGDVIWNVADNMLVYQFARFWHDAMENEAEDHFRKNLPL